MMQPRTPARPDHNTSRRTAVVVRTRGRSLAPWEDFYHWVLTLTWPRFFGWLTVAYGLVNLLFGALYFVIPGSVANADGFCDCFFFSVETFATIGYGEMTPVGAGGHALMTAEAFAGILATATITGVTFARLARPTAKVLFSDKAVIHTRNGIPHLMFRMANWRRNQIAEAQLAAMVLLTETTAEGETMRRPTRLALVRDENPMFVLTWTAMHPIDERSPFHGEGAFERLREMRAEIFLSLTGLDDTFAQTIHTRYRYSLDDIVRDARFADVLTTSDTDGARIIDFDRFHEIEILGERS
ncbi:MAG: channel inward rectifier conserved region 2 domain protein [Labilithrix sp.]|nr:channel inward rectifier conserved region 2 domain protein [Labilithrix sp.]